MKIIPVIDVLGDLAVHAVRGERQHYQPLKSVLCPSPDPFKVAEAFGKLGFTMLYLADLDAILGKPRNYRLYRRISAETGLKLMVDAGTSDPQSASTVHASGVDIVVVGTETLTGLDSLAETVDALGSEHVAVSLDVKGGRLISRSAELNGLDPLRLALKLEKLGVKYLIHLDLDRVGVECGVNTRLLEALIGGSGLKVMVGGGASSIQELTLLRGLGVYGVLMATALHNGRIGIDLLKANGML